MAKYRVLIKSSALKEIENLPKKIAQQAMKRIKALHDDPRPHGSQKLSGDEKYRIRQGDYRIVYSIQDTLLFVEVVKVAHRREVYR